MARARGRGPGSDRDGVRVETTGVRRDVWLVLGLGALAVVVVLAIRATVAPAGGPEAPPRTAATAPAARPALVPAAPRAEPPARTAAAPPGTMTRQEWRAERRAARRDARAAEKEPTFTLGTGGEPTGIAAFPPPGTKPVKPGIVVPDDFPLPEGYVRHYQTTDDGEMLPPILMFSPDYEFVDADGTPIELPTDRVVPPHLAPPGLDPKPLHVPERKPADGAP